MKKSAEETPTPKREVKEAGGFLKAIRDKEKLKIIDLVSSTIHDYAREGFAQERSSLTWQFFQAYGQIDALPEIGDRRAGISELQRETLRSINELETMLDNVNNALKLEKDFQEKIDAAKSLEKSVLYSSYWLFTYLGLSVEEIDQILTNLKVYAANHQLTLDALKRLRVNIAEARTDDIRLLGKLNAAWERGSLAGRR